MKTPQSITYNEEFEKQLLTEEDLNQARAKVFINLLSEMFLKYESEIEKLEIEEEEIIYA